MPAEGTAPQRGPTVFLVLFVLAALASFVMARPYLAAIVLALAFGYLLHPLYLRLLRPLRWRPVAAGTVLLLVAVMLLLPVVGLAFLFVGDVARVVGEVREEGLEGRAEDFLTDAGVPEDQVANLTQRLLQTGATFLQEQAVPIATLATEFLLQLTLFFILLYFVLADGPALVRTVLRILPSPPDQTMLLLERCGERVRAIVYGTFLVSVAQGILAGIGWWLLGLPEPVFWGFVMLLMAVLPGIGAFIVLLPAAAWAFFQGDIWVGVGLLVLNFVLVGLVDDVLRPYLIGRRSGVHPALVLVGIIGGLTVFGLSGIILGPLVLSLVAPLLHAWSRPRDHALEAKDTA